MRNEYILSVNESNTAVLVDINAQGVALSSTRGYAVLRCYCNVDTVGSVQVSRALLPLHY